MCPSDATHLGVKETTPHSLFTTLRNRGEIYQTSGFDEIPQECN